jgi:hypothetical protein
MRPADCILTSSDALADAVIRYERERESGPSMNAARARKRMVDAAHTAKSVNDSARALFAAEAPPRFTPPLVANDFDHEPGIA